MHKLFSIPASYTEHVFKNVVAYFLRCPIYINFCGSKPVHSNFSKILLDCHVCGLYWNITQMRFLYQRLYKPNQSLVPLQSQQSAADTSVQSHTAVMICSSARTGLCRIRKFGCLAENLGRTSFQIYEDTNRTQVQNIAGEFSNKSD